MDEPTTVLCIAQGEHRPLYAITLNLAVTKETVYDDAGHVVIEYKAYREDAQDALASFAKRNSISDPQLELGMVIVADGIGSGRAAKTNYSQVSLIEYP
jgi:hypothetical protein